MADSDKALNLAIQLKVIGKEDAEALKQLLQETALTAQQSADLEIARSGQQMAEIKRHSDVLAELKSRREAAFQGGEDVGVYDQAIKNLGGSSDSLADRGQALSQVFEELNEVSPVVGKSMQLIAGAINAISEAVAEAQKKYHDLITEGMNANEALRGIVSARPTATPEWAEITEPISKRREKTADPKFVRDQFAVGQKGIDENGVKNALDFEKPGLERKALTDEMPIDHAAIDQRRHNAGNAEDAQSNVDGTGNHANDLKKQIEELPKAIATAPGNAARATTDDNASHHVPAKGRYYEHADGQKDPAAHLQAMLDNAKAQIAELNQKLVELTNKPGLFDDAPVQEKRHQQIEAARNPPDNTGAAIEKMGAALHLTQQETVTAARRIVDQQDIWLRVLAGLHQRLDTQGQQLANLASGGHQ